MYKKTKKYIDNLEKRQIRASKARFEDLVHELGKMNSCKNLAMHRHGKVMLS